MDPILIEEPKKERKIISIDEGQVRDHLDKMGVFNMLNIN